MRVAPNQSLIDIAVQYCGSAEAAFSLAVANDISITDTLVVGTELVAVPVVNQAIVDYYARNGIVPATAPKITVTYVDTDYVADEYVE